MTDKLKFGSSGAWWSENVCDPGSEFSDRVRVKIGVGLGQGLANQKPYLGPCSQWEKRGFLWPLASVSWCRPAWLSWVWADRYEDTCHSLRCPWPTPWSLSLSLSSVFTWPASWQNDTPSSWPSSDHQTRMKVFGDLKTKRINIAVLEADIATQPASQPRPMSGCKLRSAILKKWHWYS